MLTGLSVILISGLFMGWLSKKAGLPSLMGMIIVGIVIGPNALSLIDGAVIDMAAALRQLALVIILTRAGLSLDIVELKKAGRPAVLMCFLPACFEIAGTAVMAPLIFGISLTDALVIGSVLAAVSPAVVVPRMIRLIDEGYGTDKQIPQIILAGASADDILVIVLFSAFTAIASGTGGNTIGKVLNVPVSIVLGILLGVICGMALNLYFSKMHIRDTVKVIITLSMSCLLIALQDVLAGIVSISALIAITVWGIVIKKTAPERAARMQAKYNKLWIAAEAVLFVLVGAAVDINDAFTYGLGAVLLVVTAMLFRMAGVFFSMTGTKLTLRERLFCMISFMPKATVQAAIGAVPLAMGLSCGRLALTCAVLSILISAPVGAFLIDHSYKKLLIKESE